MDAEIALQLSRKISLSRFFRRLIFFGGTSVLVFLGISWLGRMADCGPKDHDGQCGLSSWMEIWLRLARVLLSSLQAQYFQR